MKKTICLTVLVVLGLVLIACESSPVKPAGEYGYYWGSDPKISFRYTEKGIEELTMTSPDCVMETGKVLEVDSNGDFSIIGGSSLKVEGTISGTKASGTYRFSCGGVFGFDNGSWSAELVK